jgi:hypothetical protein
MYSPRLVEMSLFYRGAMNQPLDVASLRRALDLYSNSEELFIDWDVTHASVSQKGLPSFFPTNQRTLTMAPSKHKTLCLFLRDNNPQHFVSGTDPTRLISRHISQLLSVVAALGVKKTNLATEFSAPKITLAQGFSVLGKSLRGMTWEGLTRLGITHLYSVNSQRQISDSWVGPRLSIIELCSSSRCSSPVSKTFLRSLPAFHRHLWT